MVCKDVYLIQLTQDVAQCRTFLITVLNLQIALSNI
jgi:hypothetical protein